jgi:hypothetical protein
MVIFGKLSRPFCHILLPSASRGGWTQTLNLGMMRQQFYPCASTMAKYIFQILLKKENLSHFERASKHETDYTKY